MTGSTLRQMRETCGMSQQQLADVLHVTQQAVCKYEHETAEPSLNVLKSMAEIFSVPLTSLLEGETAGCVYCRHQDRISEADALMIKRFHSIPDSEQELYLQLLARWSEF